MLPDKGVNQLITTGRRNNHAVKYTPALSLSLEYNLLMYRVADDQC